MFKCLVVCWANVLFVRMHRQQQRQTQVKKATEKAKQEDSFIVCWGRCCSKRRCCIWDKDKYKDRKPKSSLKGSLNMRRRQMLHFLEIKTGAVLLRCNCCICWADALADTFIAADAKGGGRGKIKHETTEQEKANTYISYFTCCLFLRIFHWFWMNDFAQVLLCLCCYWQIWSACLHVQRWKMSNLLHGPISTNQIIPRENRVNHDIFGTSNLQNRTYGVSCDE